MNTKVHSASKLWIRIYVMMTPSNGNIFCVTGPLCGESPVNSPHWQRPVTRSFDVFFDLPPNKWLSKQSRRRWFETPSRSLWRHRNVTRPNLHQGQFLGGWGLGGGLGGGGGGLGGGGGGGLGGGGEFSCCGGQYICADQNGSTFEVAVSNRVDF